MEMTEGAWEAFWSADPFKEVVREQPLSGILAYYERLHQRVLDELADIKETELLAPSLWWEGVPMTVEFRLHRFDSHLRQHTIQAEKALASLQGHPGEIKRLLRLVYSALAEAEAAAIGAWEIGIGMRKATAGQIAGWAGEVMAALMAE